MPKRSLSDHFLIAAKAGIAAVPVVGGSLEVLLDEYLPEQAAKAAERTMNLLAEKILALGDRVDHDMIAKEDFAELFRSAMQVGARTSRETKLRAAANILANQLLREGDRAKSSYEELDHFVRIVETLSIGALTVLGAAQRAAGRFDQLRSILPEMEPSFLMSLVSELRAFNLIRVQEGAIRMPDHGGVLLEITPVGKRFVERFIEGDMG
jgi:DNA-binding HxlR family transcriptional regulator